MKKISLLTLLLGSLALPFPALAIEADMFVQPASAVPIPMKLDGSSYPYIDCVNCSGTGAAGTIGMPFPVTASPIAAQDGSGNLNYLLEDASHFLDINCQTGCAGGTFNNNADAVVTSATNGQTASWTYVFNGTTFDRWRGDTTNGGWVNVKTSVLPTGAATSAAQTTGNASLATIVTNTGASATAANQTSELTKLDTLITNTAASSSTGLATAANQTTQITNQTTGNNSLATIDTSTAASKTDLDSVVTNTAHLAAVDTSTAASKTDLDTLVTNSSNIGCAGATLANTSVKAFSNAAASTNLKLVTGVSAKKVHICAINIGPVAGAVNVALVEGTKVTNECDTGTAGMMGGATAATGWQFAANGGLTYGNGVGQLAVEATNADDTCLLFSGATQVSGVITYAVY